MSLRLSMGKVQEEEMSNQDPSCSQYQKLDITAGGHKELFFLWLSLSHPLKDFPVIPLAL